MKKTMLWAALFTVICTVHAEATQPQTPGATNSTTTNTDQSNQAPAVNQNTQNPQPSQTTQQVQPTNQQPTQTQTIPAQTTQPLPVIQQQAAPVINCDYKIAADTKVIDPTLVLTWSEKAVTQAFDFDPVSIDVQMQKLQACFTDQGWTSFNTAIQKSGNMEAIKTQKLTVSSQVDGQPKILDAQANQWKIILPLQVVYQNDKEKVTQLLNVNLTIGRKITGDLGIIQMIATPRASVDSTSTTDSANSNSTTQTAPTDAGTQPTSTNPSTPPTSTGSTTNTTNPPN